MEGHMEGTRLLLGHNRKSPRKICLASLVLCSSTSACPPPAAPAGSMAALHSTSYTPDRIPPNMIVLVGLHNDRPDHKRT